MPEIRCPRCSTLLREDDFQVYEGEHWLDHTKTIQLDCWVCTWRCTWQATSENEELVPTGAAGEGEKK